MAIVKFINGRNEKVAGLIKAIDYIADENKTEIFTLHELEDDKLREFNQEDKEAIFIEKLMIEEKGNRAINYIMKEGKTSKHLMTGINCSPDTAFDEMMITKRMYNKENGRQFIHFIHSFHKNENITPEIAHEISMKFIEDAKFNGFQVLAATHTNEDHLHTHFVLNTVNIDTGRKWQLSTKEVKELIKYSNKICEEYNLKHSFTNIEDNYYKKDKLDSKSTGEYRAKQENRSWKHELLLTINKCKKTSKNREEFINNMKELNYHVKWQDSRKYITFTTPSGNLCRNNKLENPEKYTKDSLEKIFNINQQIYELSMENNEVNIKAQDINSNDNVVDDIKFEELEDTEENNEELKEQQIENNRSWKYNLYMTIKASLKICISREEFIQYMNKEGYQVRWEDSRKDITFTFPDGKRKCNNDKLHPPEQFTKDALEKRFKSNKDSIKKYELNKEHRQQAKKEHTIQATKEMILSTIKMLEQYPELGGSKSYPLSYLEGQAAKEMMLEKAKGEGLDWEKEKER